MLSCASPVAPAPGERWTERRAVAWPQETVQVEPHGGDGLGETPEGVSPRPGARGHDTWAVVRTQHGSVRTALAPSVRPVLSPSTDLRPPGSVTAIVGAPPQGHTAQRVVVISTKSEQVLGPRVSNQREE